VTEDSGQISFAHQIFMDIFALISNHPLHSVLTVIMIGGFGYLLKVSIFQRQNINAAGKEIVSAFQPELNNLLQTGDDCRLILDSTAFKRHDDAIRNNIDRLSVFQRRRVRKAWYRLAYHEQNNKIPFYEQYADYGSLDRRNKMRPVAISRIQRIINLVS
jgi:hypothetical protein